jgi:hypothetical protein
VDELLADVEFCRTHQCRPARFAEHACTAADFFYQVNAFEEAEQTLGAAIQVCRRVEAALGFLLHLTAPTLLGLVQTEVLS